MNRPKIVRLLRLGAVVLGCVLPQVVRADGVLDSGDTAWIIVASALVLMMTLPGLALFYAGLVRSVNVLSVMIHCYAIACIASVLWFVLGYSLAFSDGGAINPWLGGLGKSFLMGVTIDSMFGSIPEMLFFMFQLTFAIITPALMVGAYVERIKFSHVLLLSALWLIVVYAPVTHWVWGGGFLSALGVLDFAGGLVVHASAAASAIAIVLVLGKRHRFPHDLTPPHNPGLTVIGASLLWVGWFGFNAGSALAANGNAAGAMVATHLSAAAASLVWLVCEWTRFGKPSLIGIATGTIAGLATVTPAAGFIGPGGGLVCGLLGGAVCYGAVYLLRNRLEFDDSLDVFAVHGVGGICGTLLVAVLGAQQFGGIGLEVGIATQLYRQVVGVLVVSIWSAGVTYFLVLLTRALVGLRVDPKDEAEGLDFASHGERSYNL